MKRGSNFGEGSDCRGRSRGEPALAGPCGGAAGVVESPSYEVRRLFTVAELARLLRVSPRTVEDWLYRKAIPFTRIGRKPYISTDVVNGLLARNAQPAFAGNRPVSGSNTKPKKEVQPCVEASHG